MKIINNTAMYLAYLVTQSGNGSSVSGAVIVASGAVARNCATEFSVPNAGTNPWVFVRAASTTPSQNYQGFIGRQCANGDSTVAITFEEN